MKYRLKYFMHVLRRPVESAANSSQLKQIQKTALQGGRIYVKLPIPISVIDLFLD